MIISRAPMRISFLGGTTDYSSYFEHSEVPGRVLGSSINQYVYVTILEQPSFERIKFRFSWRFTESVSDFHEITHPVLRTVLEKEKWEKPLNISTMANLPGRSGLGSSSAFTVALISAIEFMKRNSIVTPEQLAKSAIQIERVELQEPGGIQDQYHSAVGGFRMYEFTREGVTFSQQIRDEEFRHYLSESTILVATGGGRDSGIHAQRTSSNIQSRVQDSFLANLSALTLETFSRVENAVDSIAALQALAEGMKEGWRLKKSISRHTNSEVDELIDFGMKRGAKAGKLCGAGGSGFAAFLINPEEKEEFCTHFQKENLVNLEYTTSGQEIILK